MKHPQTGFLSEMMETSTGSVSCGGIFLSPTGVEMAKVALLATGLRVSRGVEDSVAQRGKQALRVRSGSCGGLEVILPGGIYANCPVNERFALASPFWIEETQDHFFICSQDGLRLAVDLVPSPRYYGVKSRDGTSLSRIGQTCGDRLGIGLTNDCTYWRAADRRCKFCSIGLNLGNEQRNKGLTHILEVVEAAYADPVAPARHLLLGGGTPTGPDSGALRIAEAARVIKQRWKHPIYAMIVPPADNGYIELLKESGVDEVGMNIELFDQEVAARIIPGKKNLVGLDRYFSALEYAVGIFGPVNTRSIMVVGLERPESTVLGVEALASRGVMPILSPFRPMTGTELENHPTPDPGMLWEVCIAATETAGRYGIPLGPVCIPCQGNTLNLPGHPSYLYY